MFYICAAVTLGAAGLVIHFFLTVTPSTGMEGLALVFIAIAFVGIYSGAFLGWGIIRIFKPT